MFDRRGCKFAALALAMTIVAGCGHARATQNAATPAPGAAGTARAETRDVDAALKRLDHDGTIQSYHIDDERLTGTVDPGGWNRLDPKRQDALKRAVWEAWSASYMRNNDRTNARIFLSVEDTAGNDLGSYFAH